MKHAAALQAEWGIHLKDAEATFREIDKCVLRRYTCMVIYTCLHSSPGGLTFPLLMA
jgi:hypothetical protein